MTPPRYPTTSEGRSGRVIIVGAGAAGLAAAWTLKKRGIKPIVLEATANVGGRMRGDHVGGFFLDAGADFFCSSYDVAFRLCEELRLPLCRSALNFGWYRNGRWAVTVVGNPVLSPIRNFKALRMLGALSVPAGRFLLKLVSEIRRQSEHLNFSSDSRIVEIDGTENFGDYLERLGAPETLKVTLKGFLEMTMGHVETAGAAYMRTYLAEMLLKDGETFVPERGAGALARALADACGDAIRVSTPVRRVPIVDGAATSVITDDGPIAADAVICAVPATRVADIIPDLPTEVRNSLSKVTYSTGVRVVIGLDHPPLPAGWHGALYPEDDTPLLLDRSIKLNIAPPGKSTLDLLVGRERAEELLPLDDEEIKRQMLSDARRTPPPGSALPQDDEGLFTQVYRWKEAVCMAPPGMFRVVADMKRRLGRDMKSLFLAGDYMEVPSVNGALASGVAAAEQVVQLLEMPPRRVG